MFEYTDYQIIIASVAYAICFILTVLLYGIFGNKSVKTRKAVLNSVILLIFILEIGKQVRNILPHTYYFDLTFNSVEETIPFREWALPFHFCSFFFFFPLLSIITRGKIKDFFENIGAFWSFIIFIGLLIWPEPIYGEAVSKLYVSNYLDHGFVFHSLVNLYTLLLFALNPFEFSIKKVWYAPLALLFYAAVTIPAAIITKVNFVCILDPIFSPAVQEFLANYGYFVYVPLYLLFGMVLVSLAYIVFVLVTKLVKKINCPNGFAIGCLISGLIITPIAYWVNSLESKTIYTYFPILLGILIIPSLLSIIILRFVNRKPKGA